MADELAEGLSAEIEEAIRVIEAIRMYARPEILRWFSPDSCIASTRVVFDLLRLYDLKPRAMACVAHVLNAKLLARIEKEGHFPNEKELRAWSRQDGSWNVGIGGTGVKSGRRWDGHLVAIATEQVMIDISIDQASRPRKGIVLKPITATVPVDWVEGGHEFSVEEGGCRIFYKALPYNREWVNTVGWQGHKELRKQMVDRIALKVEKHVASFT